MNDGTVYFCTRFFEKYNKQAKSGIVNEPVAPYGTSGPVTFEKEWLMFQETDKKRIIPVGSALTKKVT